MYNNVRTTARSRYLYYIVISYINKSKTIRGRDSLLIIIAFNELNERF